MLHRAMRDRYPRLRAREVPTSSVRPAKLTAKVFRGLNLAALERLGLCTADMPLEVCVRHAADRPVIPELCCHVRSLWLPGGSFLELSTTPRFHDELPEKSECRILVDSVPLVVATMGSDLHKLVRCSKITKDDAIVLLTRLMGELCGTYGRSPTANTEEGVRYDVAPLCHVKEIRAYLAELHDMEGVGIARAAARIACDNLASPMEFVTYAALAFPPRLGGLHINDVLVNQALDEGEELAVLGIRRLTPDFRFGRKPIVIEYQGSEHLEKYRVRKDKVRAQAYAALGIRQYPLMVEDVSCVSALDKTLRIVVDLLSPYENQSFRKRTLAILRDGRCRKARERLLELCLGRAGTVLGL